MSFIVEDWELIYSQTAPTRAFKEHCKIDSCNLILDESNFMNLDVLKNDRDFHFKLQWDDDEYVTWYQDEG